MSKYIDEIIKDIKTNPDSWRDQQGNGIKKGDVTITGYGNTAILSCISVYVNYKEMPAKWYDNYRLERAVGWWYRNVSLATISLLH